MAVAPDTPVLVGFGELVRRPGEGGEEPAALMAEAVRLAVADAGAADSDALLRRAGVLAGIPSAGWPDGDPARRVAELLGLDGVRTLRSSLQGGNGPQLVVNALAARIAAGQLDAAIVTGAEALYTVARGGAAWPPADGDRAAGEVLEGEAAPNTDAELAVGLIAPIMAYPLIENALRAAAGRTVAEHQAVIAGLWSRFSEVAATRACAWTPEARTPAEIGEPSAANRRVSFPYPKLMNSNIQVDQAAALVLCSAATASALGVPRDHWVFLHAGAAAADEWFLSHRASLASSPAIAACGQAVFDHAGVGPADLGPVDLYSCFPAAVQLGADALGLSLDRPLTETGGLTFFGGPGNNYATHGIGAVARALRDAGGDAVGLASALGWYATKHAVGLYGAAPPARGYAAFEPEVAATAARAVAEPGDYEATAETCTVIYERDGSPSYGILFALCDDGRRVLGRTRERAVLEAMPGDGFLGARVRLDGERGFAPA
jgi:acetyl-CoA C-acetyltransferase